MQSISIQGQTDQIIYKFKKPKRIIREKKREQTKDYLNRA